MSFHNHLLTLKSFSTNLDSIDRNEVKIISLQDCREEAVPESFFTQFPNLEKVVFSVHLTWIRDNAFRGCSKLKSVRFERNSSHLKVIGNSAFYDCVELKQIYLSDHLLYIGNSAFYSCKSLEEINIPNHVNFIGISAFADCESLRSVHFGSKGNLKTLNEYAFQNTGLVKVKLPESVEVIGPYCFYNCQMLKQVQLSSNVRVIYQLAFASCKELESIKYSSKEIILISKDAFLGSHKIQKTVNKGMKNQLLSYTKIVTKYGEEMKDLWNEKYKSPVLTQNEEVLQDVNDRAGFEEPDLYVEPEVGEELAQQEEEDETDRLHEELEKAYEEHNTAIREGRESDGKRIAFIIQKMSDNERKRDPDRQKIIKELYLSIDFMEKQLLDVQSRMEKSRVTIDEGRTDSISLELRKLDRMINKHGISTEEENELRKRKDLLHVEQQLIREYSLLNESIEEKISAVYKMIKRLETDS